MSVSLGAITAARANRIARAISGRLALGQFVEPGERMPNNGSLDASPLLKRARDYVAAHPELGPVQVEVPAGLYRMTEWIEPADNFGVRGAGRLATIFMPVGEATFLKKDAPAGEPTMNCYFDDFTIDGINQDGALNDSGIKGIHAEDIQRWFFHDVGIVNVWGTGFGLDWCKDVWLTNCWAENCGRGFTSTGAAGAGFGFSVGLDIRESMTMVNCWAVDNQSQGIFLEQASGLGAIFSTGFKAIGCHMRGNFNGFADEGGGGATLTDCEITGNLGSGVMINKGGNSLYPGRDGEISDCYIADNGRDTGHGGIRFAGDLADYRIVNNRILRNRTGIRFDANVTTSGTVEIKGNRIKENQRSGIISFTTGVIANLEISDNRISDNGDALSDYRDGITVLGDLDNPTIEGNRIWDSQTVKTQRWGIRILGDMTTPAIQHNDVRGNEYKNAQVYSGSIDDSTYIRDNRADATLGLYSDDFNRPDGTPGAAAGGSAIPVDWFAQATWAIASHRMTRVSGSAAQTANYIETGVSDVEVTATIGAWQGATAAGGVVIRAVDASNYLQFSKQTAGTYVLLSRIAGSYTNIHTSITIAAVNDVVRVVAVGDQIECYVNDVLITTQTVTDFETATSHGVSSDLTAWIAWDNFIVEEAP